MNECPLCYSKVVFPCVDGSFLASCNSGCLQKVVKPASTESEAQENFQAFKKELEFGAEMWGSKIRDGVTED